MPTDIKTRYGLASQSITIDFQLLSNNLARQSVFVDNNTNLFLDALVRVKALTASSGVSATGFINVYAYGSEGAGFTEGATGADGFMFISHPNNLRLIGVANAALNSYSVQAGPFSVAAAFGGMLPEKWGLVISNATGTQLQSVAGNFSLSYQGVYGQSV